MADERHDCDERSIDFVGDDVLPDRAVCSCGRTWELRKDDSGKPTGWRMTRYGGEA